MFLLVLSCMSMQAQLVTSDLKIGGSYENDFDVFDVARYPREIAQEPFAKRAFAASEAESGTAWIHRINNLPAYLSVFYDDYKIAIDEVLSEKKNWLSDPTLGIYNENENSYSIAVATFEGSLEFTFPKDASADLVGEYAYAKVAEACNAKWNEYNTFMPYLCMTLTYDNPKAFWVNSYYRWSTRWMYSYGYNASLGTGKADYMQVMYFGLKTSDFDCRHEDFLTQELVSQGVTEFKSKVKDVVSQCSATSRYEQIRFFNNWLTTSNCYNSDLGHVDKVATIAWSPMSALRGSTGKVGPVCEAYARAFKILCDEKNIPCHVAVGFAKGSRNGQSESHMWNEVQMENGKWYAVDVTWNDPSVNGISRKVSGYENENWLLLGNQDVVGQNLTFGESHPCSFTWNGFDDVAKSWDVAYLSLIEDESYLAGVETLHAASPTAGFRVSTLSGQYLGTYDSLDEVRRCGSRGQMLIVNNRVCVVRR